MKKTSDSRAESYILPAKLVDFVEDTFSGILSFILLCISVGALFYSLKQMLTTHPFFPHGMIDGINNILFIVIILEIVRTIISRFTDGIFQLEKFLVIGVIAAVRHILTVGASLTLESTKSDHIFYRDLWQLGLDAVISLILVIAIFISRMAHRNKE